MFFEECPLRQSYYNFSTIDLCFFRKCRLANARDTFKAALCVGRQPRLDVWVFGPELQLKGDGSITNPDESCVLWVQEVLDLQEDHCKTTTAPGLPIIRLPLYAYAIRDVIKSLISTIHDNIMAGIFTIGMSVINQIHVILM